ncbi:hypothetical protein J6590_089539 [Homalodisca vitripennis]|nr:hypothetical protein J6590_089539 [Homalodisca vitripennis]
MVLDNISDCLCCRCCKTKNYTFGKPRKNDVVTVQPLSRNKFGEDDGPVRPNRRPAISTIQNSGASSASTDIPGIQGSGAPKPLIEKPPPKSDEPKVQEPPVHILDPTIPSPDKPQPVPDADRTGSQNPPQHVPEVHKPEIEEKPDDKPVNHDINVTKPEDHQPPIHHQNENTEPEIHHPPQHESEIHHPPQHESEVHTPGIPVPSLHLPDVDKPSVQKPPDLSHSDVGDTEDILPPLPMTPPPSRVPRPSWVDKIESFESPEPSVTVIIPSKAPGGAETDVLTVREVDMCLTLNGSDHHTDRYELMTRKVNPQLVIRRGQPFQLDLVLSRAYNPATDAISFVFTLSGGGGLGEIPRDCGHSDFRGCVNHNKDDGWGSTEAWMIALVVEFLRSQELILMRFRGCVNHDKDEHDGSGAIEAWVIDLVVEFVRSQELVLMRLVVGDRSSDRAYDISRTGIHETQILAIYQHYLYIYQS